MRVLRISAGLDPRHGGPAHSTLLSALAVRRAGVNVEVATIDEGVGSAAAVERLRRSDVRVHLFRLSHVPGAWRFSISASLARWVLANGRRFDVLHVHGAWTGTSMAGLVTGRACGIPVVLTPHESLTEHDLSTSGPGMRAVKRALRRVYLAALDATIFASQLELCDSHGDRAIHPVVLPHPVEAVPSPKGVVRTGRLRVGFLGRFDPKKNLDLLLQALPPNADLIVAGDGPPETRASLRAVAAAAGVEDQIEWLGFVEGDVKARFFESLDVLAMPSRYECFGMVAAEALAAGVPVIVSPATGIAPIVRRHRCGTVVEPEPERLRAVLEHPENLVAKTSRTLAAVHAELGFGPHGEALAQLYEQIQKRSG